MYELSTQEYDTNKHWGKKYQRIPKCALWAKDIIKQKDFRYLDWLVGAVKMTLRRE